MKQYNFQLQTTELQKLAAHLDERFNPDYFVSTDAMAVLLKEEFYLRNNSTQINTIVLVQNDGNLEVDAIGGGGSTGLLKISWGSESSFIKEVKTVIEEWAKKNSVRMEMR